MDLFSNRSFLLSKYRHADPESLKLICNYVHNVAPTNRCEFVQSLHSCDGDSGFFQYHYFLYCTIDEPGFSNPVFLLLIFVIVLWFALLFFYLAITVDEFFCPALGVISKVLHLSENLAGVTLLALGNGAPDIMSSIFSSSGGDTLIMVNQLLGSAMFITSFIAGMVVVVRPFKMQIYPFVRDMLFIFGAIFWVKISSNDYIVDLFESISFICIYAVYLIVVIGGYFIEEKRKKSMIHLRVDWTDLSKKKDEDLFDEDDELVVVQTPEEPDHVTKHMTLCQEFWYNLSPTAGEDWKLINKGERAIIVLKTPLVFLLRLCIPVVNFGSPKNGWCKLLNTINIILLPTFYIAAAKAYKEELFGVNICAYFSPLGIIFALIIFFTSKQHKAPPYHFTFAFLNFIACMLIIFLFVHEVVALLNLLGTLLNIRSETLGLTVLAWGNAFGEAITNISISRKGYQRMAFAGCFAGALTNTMLSLGISFFVQNLQKESRQTTIRVGIMGPLCMHFLLINLIFTLLYVLISNFDARKSYGIFLITIYVQFLLFCLLCEIRLIHPFGTDHQFDSDI